MTSLNEPIDNLAKIAANDRHAVSHPSGQDILPSFSKTITQEWQHIWRNGDLGRYFFSIIPEVRMPFDKNLEIHESRIVNRLAANHYHYCY